MTNLDEPLRLAPHHQPITDFMHQESSTSVLNSASTPGDFAKPTFTSSSAPAQPLSITTFPKEILHLILLHLADIDLKALFALRQMCKAIQAVATAIIDKACSTHGLAIHNFQNALFSPLLDSSTAGPVLYYNVYDGRAPFRALPWASDPEIRARFLRPEASWRRLPLCSPSGTIVNRMQVVAIGRFVWPEEIDDLEGLHVAYPSEEGDSGEVRYQAPNGMRFGEYYDMVIRQDGEPTRLGGGWKLLFGKRVRDPDEFMQWEIGVRRGDRVITEESEVEALLEEDEFCATLWLYGGMPPKSQKNYIYGDSEMWEPFPIDKKHTTICYRFG